MNTHRQIVKAADVQVATGKSKSASAKMLRTVKGKINKEKYQPVTIDDFCSYYGLDKQPIIDIIINNDLLKKRSSQSLKTEAVVEMSKPIADVIAEAQPQRIKRSEPDPFARRALYEQTRFEPRKS